MTRIHHIFAGLCVAAMGFGAQAQVVRCTDARTGKVTYTDGKCASGTTVLEVEARKTPEQIQIERDQAAQALAQKQERLKAEAAAAQTEALRNPRPRDTQPAPSQDHARSAECARSRRNLDIVLGDAGDGTYEQNLRMQAAQRQVDLDCLGPEGYAQAERARAAGSNGAAPVVVVPPYYPAHPVRPVRPVPTPTPPAKNFTQCNVFRCYDGKGNSYPR